MLATLLTATVLAFCNAQVDPKDRTFPFYGYNPNPGSFLYEDVDSGLQLTYNLTENGNMMYGIECQQSFEAGPFRFPCISKVPPDFINFVIDIDSIDVLYNGSRTACPSLDFAEGDLEEFSFNSPDRDSGTIQFQEGTYRSGLRGLGECSGSHFLFYVTRAGSLEISCTNGRSGDKTAVFGPYKVSQERPGKPYDIDFGGGRLAFLAGASEICGLCFKMGDTDVETSSFYDGGIYTKIAKKRSYLDRLA
ncbi:hypothetical protein FOL46_006782 [Perkinsus olseni]|uniref:Uncharacterized protein n=1 Tax=Perkinsus olseni TaxID=32597 RepID=A0A7J6LHZ6_PEROL|nr:hypothetical protein FOL46_006782 [Perkinsus olseni]